jgi:type IV secretory pathway VirB2 component (pilin)
MFFRLHLTLMFVANGLMSLRASAEDTLPWEGTLNTIIDSLSGPVAKGIATIAIIMLGFAFAFSEGGSMMQKVIGVVFGLSIAFGAASIVASFWGTTDTGGSGGG